jgi:hypothetical protein
LKSLTLLMGHLSTIDAGSLEEGTSIIILGRGGMIGTENRPVGVILAVKEVREGFAEHTQM